MSNGAPGLGHPHGQVAPLPDVTRLSFVELFSSSDNALGHAVRRVVAELERPQEVIAAFANFVDESYVDPL